MWGESWIFEQIGRICLPSWPVAIEGFTKGLTSLKRVRKAPLSLPRFIRWLNASTRTDAFSIRQPWPDPPA